MTDVAWEPNLRDVASIIRARTRDTNGVERETFTSDTRPTTAQADEIIHDATTQLAAQLGDVPTEFSALARHSGALYSAMLVELTYFPEQVVTGRSPYDRLKELFNESLAILRTALVDSGADVPGGAEGTPDAPVYAFPSMFARPAMVYYDPVTQRLVAVE